MSPADARARDSDTIVAIATPPGAGAIGVIRVSGPAACKSVSPLLCLTGGRRVEAARPRVLHHVRVLDPATGAQIDDALAAFMPRPHSYTGEDVVEISCHGNPVLLAEIVRKVVGGGARLAEPGEFTRRAYLNGRLDLVQAEAVALLIGARTERAARLAARQVEGALSGELRALRESVLDLVAGLEVSLDFPEEAVGVSRGAACERCERVATRLGRLVAGARQGRLLDEGLTVMLAGAPNVGKSSLLNALLERDRAIVSPDPGTTRDVVDGVVLVEGVTVRLMDGAGLGTPQDAVDAEGMMRSRRAIAESDLVMVVLDRSRTRSVADEEVLRVTADRPRLVIANKSDLPSAQPDDGVDCVCSALSAAGIEVLRTCLAAWVLGRVSIDAEEGGIVASLRVIGRLEEAQAGLERASEGLGIRMPLEVVLVDLRVTLSALDETLGCRADDAVLDRIFATFCVGK